MSSRLYFLPVLSGYVCLSLSFFFFACDLILFWYKICSLYVAGNMSTDSPSPMYNLIMLGKKMRHSLSFPIFQFSWKKYGWTCLGWCPVALCKHGWRVTIRWSGSVATLITSPMGILWGLCRPPVQRRMLYWEDKSNRCLPHLILFGMEMFPGCVPFLILHLVKGYFQDLLEHFHLNFNICILLKIWKISLGLCFDLFCDFFLSPQ